MDNSLFDKPNAQAVLRLYLRNVQSWSYLSSQINVRYQDFCNEIGTNCLLVVGGIGCFLMFVHPTVVDRDFIISSLKGV